jgi:PAS domain-containing protein
MLGPPSIPWPPTARGGWSRRTWVREGVAACTGRGAPRSTRIGCLGDPRPTPRLPANPGRADDGLLDELRYVYGNAAWRAWVPREKFPVEGQPLPEILERLGDSPLFPILRQVCATGVAAHLRDFEYVGLVGAPVTLPGDVTVWDWEVYPLTDAQGVHSHLLMVAMDATDGPSTGLGSILTPGDARLKCVRRLRFWNPWDLWCHARNGTAPSPSTAEQAQAGGRRSRGSRSQQWRGGEAAVLEPGSQPTCPESWSSSGSRLA